MEASKAFEEGYVPPSILKAGFQPGPKSKKVVVSEHVVYHTCIYGHLLSFIILFVILKYGSEVLIALPVSFFLFL